MNTPHSHQTNSIDIVLLQEWLQQHRSQPLVMRLQFQNAIQGPNTSYSGSEAAKTGWLMPRLDRLAVNRYITRIQRKFPDITLANRYYHDFRMIAYRGGHVFPVDRIIAITLDIQPETLASITSMHTLERLLTESLPKRLTMRPLVALDWKSEDGQGRSTCYRSFQFPSQYSINTEEE